MICREEVVRLVRVDRTAKRGDTSHLSYRAKAGPLGLNRWLKNHI